MVRQAWAEPLRQFFRGLRNRLKYASQAEPRKGGKPFAMLVPLGSAVQARKPGSARGKITVREDFDDPLPDDLLRGFTG